MKKSTKTTKTTKTDMKAAAKRVRKPRKHSASAVAAANREAMLGNPGNANGPATAEDPGVRVASAPGDKARAVVGAGTTMPGSPVGKAFLGGAGMGIGTAGPGTQDLSTAGKGLSPEEHCRLACESARQAGLAASQAIKDFFASRELPEIPGYIRGPLRGFKFFPFPVNYQELGNPLADLIHQARQIGKTGFQQAIQEAIEKARRFAEDQKILAMQKKDSELAAKLNPVTISRAKEVTAFTMFVLQFCKVEQPVPFSIDDINPALFKAWRHAAPEIRERFRKAAAIYGSILSTSGLETEIVNPEAINKAYSLINAFQG